MHRPKAPVHIRKSVAEEDLHQPNDKLFRTTFGAPENASALLKATLPPAVAALVDWSKLRLLPGSFVDSKFRASHTDLLFSAPMVDHDALIYVLFEHQSARDRLLSLRLLRYMVRIWEQLAESAIPPARLPVILPVVLSQNARSWNLDPRFTGLLDLPDPMPREFGPFIPDFSFQHLQLADMEFDAIPGTATGILVLRVLKADRLRRLLDDAVWDEDLILRAPREVFDRVLRYILAADVDREAFDAKIHSLSNLETRSAAMTLAESLRQEGRQEGRQTGQQEGLLLGRQIALQEAVLNVLTTRFPRVPDSLRHALFAVRDEETLRALLRAAIGCPSLEVFAEGL